MKSAFKGVPMNDKIVIAEALGGAVRIRIANTTKLVEAARNQHDCFPTSCAALGRVLTVNAIMASELKDPEARCVTTINGRGPAGTIVAQANGNGDVRGFIGDPHLYYLNEKTQKLDVGRIVGTNGTLTVTKDLGLKEPFTGVVELQSGEIGEDFSYYFMLSEQIPSLVSVGVLVNTDTHVKAAGGLIIQLLPGASEEVIQTVEDLSKTMKPMSTYIDEGYSCEEIINTLFSDVHILDEKEIRWYCGCDKEQFARALTLIDPNEVHAMLEEDHGAEVTCQYCGKQYHFNEEELKEILEKQKHVENREHQPKQ